MIKRKIAIASLLSSVSVAFAINANDTSPKVPPAALPNASATSTIKVDSPNYQPGGVATVYPLVSQGRGNYQQGAPIGSFVNTANPWTLNMHLKQPDLAFFKGKPLGYEVDAYFVAKEAGNYSFATTVAVPPSVVFTDPDHPNTRDNGWIECKYWLSVADQKLFDVEISTRAQDVQDEDRFCGLNQFGVGAIKLDIGLHHIRQWLACSGNRRLKNPGSHYAYPKICRESGDQKATDFTTDNFPGDEAQVTLRVRHPQDNTPVLVKNNELVHEQR